ncbi:MAG: hypothetical protein R3C44_12465 [Chloroflexota bacterium]
MSWWQPPAPAERPMNPPPAKHRRQPGCFSPGLCPTGSGQATVDSIEILILESFPVQVHVIARGNLPDGCTTIDQVISQQDDSVFRVAVTTFRQPDAICTEALVPFEETIPLDVAGLPAGTYQVVVNGVQDSFTLDVDNALPEDMVEPTTESTEPATATGGLGIGGTVWHDLCGITGSAVTEARRCLTDALLRPTVPSLLPMACWTRARKEFPASRSSYLPETAQRPYRGMRWLL